MLFRGTCGSADAVASCAAAEHENHITLSGAFAAYVGCLNCTYNCTNLKTLGNIVGVLNLTHMGRCKAYLVAVRWLACGCT